jgi:N-acetylmuramoyl-L-alanine amidase
VLLKFYTPRFTQQLRLCLCALAFFCVHIAQAASVNNVRVWRAEGYTRIVLDLDEPVRYNMVLANNPTRIILSLASTNLNASISKLPLAKTPIEIVRSSIIDNVDLRLVFDLKNSVSPKSYLLKKSDGNSDRLVIDLYTADPASAVATQKLGASSEPVNIESLLTAAKPEPQISANKSTNISSNTPTNNTNGKAILIAVDAGHGGVDSGALGPKNMREKDVTLAIAKELVRVINAQPGYSARLTRSGDYFVELQKRRDLARDMKADLFISVHADSFSDPSAYGASVFALSRKGATSEMARFLAQRENDSDLIGRVGGVSLDDKDAQLAGVLVDLSMTATVNSSLQVGSHVLSSISSIAPLHAKHVEQAGFVVLKSPDVPSILVETGFISNTAESRKLASAAYRGKMAQAIFNGVRRYFAQHPPASSTASSYEPSEKNTVDNSSAEKRAADIKSTDIKGSGIKNSENKSVKKSSDSPLPARKHKVIRGDTLTDIALKYGVKASEIRKLNNMKNDTVKLGQSLKIPAQ